ncbi:MAG: CRISPR-associated protein Cas4 [bacterium]|nr:CRISPR-associated protein Cas4 [bacterium]
MKYYLRPTDVKNFIFCPYRFYYSYVNNIGYTKSNWDRLGKLAEHARREEILAKVEKEFENVFSSKQLLASEKYGLRGIPDMVLRHKKFSYYAVLEIKYSKRLRAEQVYSLASYALLLEDNGYYPVKELLLFLTRTNKLYRFHFSPELRKKTENILALMRKIIDGKLEPWPNSAHCHSCDFQNYCPWWKHRADR